MNQPPATNLSDRELTADLKAAVAARHELGADMEDPVIDAFLGRLQQRIDAQVAQQVQERLPAAKSGSSAGVSPAAIIVPSLVFSIPLIAIAGGIAGGLGIFFVMVAVVLINVLYWVDRWR